eukprot:Gb_32285 [translate_table: standard]
MWNGTGIGAMWEPCIIIDLKLVVVIFERPGNFESLRNEEDANWRTIWVGGVATIHDQKWIPSFVRPLTKDRYGMRFQGLWSSLDTTQVPRNAGRNLRIFSNITRKPKKERLEDKMESITVSLVSLRLCTKEPTLKQLGVVSVKDMEAKIKKMERYIASTSNLYRELEVLNALEHSATRMQQQQQQLQNDDANGNGQKYETLYAFQQKVMWQRKACQNRDPSSIASLQTETTISSSRGSSLGRLFKECLNSNGNYSSKLQNSHVEYGSALASNFKLVESSCNIESRNCETLAMAAVAPSSNNFHPILQTKSILPPNEHLRQVQSSRIYNRNYNVKSQFAPVLTYC